MIGSRFEDQKLGTAIGAGTGAAAGALTGQALEPEQAKLLRKVVGTVIRDLPAMPK
ncbi:hypothetical protein JD969_10930 [Planctomycetota bacterium]|nr:hypothetical protein JD969_10930 [Planctomycetota bacterium]